ncbi:putative serine protease EDA2 [Acorus calamus]|uniref:Serine protease EDA2 n=1 Tax=Acorus calamus TaxID=4465 RepID=A0AAV9E6V2_ACOCL|nr:putative serine protease EDA2 [Acorus calamus]
MKHRYYGESIPFRSQEEAFRNASTLGYFTSSQALADYAELKKNLSVESCPVIAVGGSYGGMLVAWFRLKYPHIAMGALASSVLILLFDDITTQEAFLNVVSKDFWPHGATQVSKSQLVRQKKTQPKSEMPLK